MPKTALAARMLLLLLLAPSTVLAGNIDTGTTSWMLTSTALVLLMVPGLVVITPAAGVVQPTGAPILGALSSIACYYALNMKTRLGYDDSLDCFGIHGIGSGLGVLLLSFFIRDSWMQAAAANVAGWNAFNQLLFQMKGMAATIVLAAAGTALIFRWGSPIKGRVKRKNTSPKESSALFPVVNQSLPTACVSVSSLNRARDFKRWIAWSFDPHQSPIWFKAKLPVQPVLPLAHVSPRNSSVP